MLTPTERKEVDKLLDGQWADCDAICKALRITFGTGLKIFEYSRTASWNEASLNGQCIETRFRLRPEAKDVFVKS